MSDRTAAPLASPIHAMAEIIRSQLGMVPQAAPSSTARPAASISRAPTKPKFRVPEIKPLNEGDQVSFPETETGQIKHSGETPPPQREISPVLIAALDSSEGFDGTGFFVNRRDRRVEMTATAFVLFQALLAGGDAAVDLALARIPPGYRQRAPSRAKLELLAITLTAKPKTTEEQKACSAYASLLIVAQTHGVTTEGYCEWARGINLADAEVQAKRIRAALKASVADGFEGDSTPHEPTYELQVAVLVNGKAKDAVRVVIEDHQAHGIRTLISEARATGDLMTLASDIAEASAPRGR